MYLCFILLTVLSVYHSFIFFFVTLTDVLFYEKFIFLIKQNKNIYNIYLYFYLFYEKFYETFVFK